MLPELHHVLKELIYDQGRIDRADVDVSFEVPTKEWTDKLVRPTINLYLCELQENTDLRQAQFQSTRTNGHSQLRAAPRRIDLRYVVTTLTTDSDDAFRLLWHVLGVLMRASELDPALFPDDVVLEAPIVTRVAQPDAGLKLLDVWSALSAEPRAAFCYVVTLPMDLQLTFEHPFVLGRSLAYRDRTRDNEVVEQHTVIHGRVLDPPGHPLPRVLVSTLAEPRATAETDAAGAFSLRTPGGGKLALRLTAEDGRAKDVELDLDAPATAYDLVLS
jgi:hypothetical protein